MTTIVFERRFLGTGETVRLGAAKRHQNGWRFYPNNAARKPSRKDHPTLESCLPRWLNYPDGCMSREEV